MPGVADPGERLVRAAVRAGLIVEVVPGPSAAIAAVVASGLPTGRWVFEGFLPRKGAGSHGAAPPRGGRGADDRALRGAPPPACARSRTSSWPAGATRWVAVARELTKLHEEVWRGSLVEAVEWARDHEPRGEMVLVVDGAPPPVAARRRRRRRCRPAPPRRRRHGPRRGLGGGRHPRGLEAPRLRRGSPTAAAARRRQLNVVASAAGEVPGGQLGGDDVDQHAGALLEPGQAGEPRDHVDVPVERALVVVRGGVEHEVVGDVADLACAAAGARRGAPGPPPRCRRATASSRWTSWVRGTTSIS